MILLNFCRLFLQFLKIYLALLTLYNLSTQFDSYNLYRHCSDNTIGVGRDAFTTFFRETSGLQPQSLMKLRLETYPPTASLKPEQLIHGKEDTANNFVRGHYTV
ncbi:Tubulin alpha-1A chain [Ranunculus cassubicifolius]